MCRCIGSQVQCVEETQEQSINMEPCTEHELLAELQKADDFSEYFLDNVPVKLYAKLNTDPEVETCPIWEVMSLPFNATQEQAYKEHGEHYSKCMTGEASSPYIITIDRKKKRIEIRNDKKTNYVAFRRHNSMKTLVEAVVDKARKTYEIREIF